MEGATKLAFLALIFASGVPEILSAYPGCGTTQSCFGSESGCIVRGDCSMLAAFQFDNTTKVLNFMLQASGLSSNGYVAMGISTDTNMGSDLVFFCPNSAQGSPSVSYNVRKSNTIDVTGVTLTNKFQQSVNGILTCNFTVPTQLTPVVSGTSQTSLDLVANLYYILFAKGPMSGSSLGEHDSKMLSGSPINFTVNGVDVEAGENTAGFKVHGCLMSLAWLGTAPTGMLFARYYRKTWTSVKPCGKDSWFRFHQIFMSTTVIVTLIGLIIMLALEGLDPFGELGDNPHPVIGLVSIICAIIQPIMAAFRPHPGTSNRPMFNWAHRIVGNLALIFGIVAIFLAFGYESLNLPDALSYALIGWAFIYFVVQLVLSIGQCVGKKAEEDNGDESGYVFRKIVAVFYLLFLLAFVVAFIVVIAKS